VRLKKAVGPLISVLMPVQNGVQYVGRAIDSIIDQTLDDWELVVIDNASTDGTDAYVRRRAAADTRIVFRRIEEDLSVAGNLNAGLALCRGEWLALMDPSDRAMPNRLERQLAFMLQNRDAAVVNCLAYYINAAGGRMAPPPYDLATREALSGDMQPNEAIGVLPRGAFMRREVLNGAGDNCSQFETHDIDLWNRLAETGPSLIQAEYLMEYRVGSSSQPASFFRRECSRPLNESLSQSRIALGQRLYREAGECKLNGRVVSSALRLAGAIALRPVYSSGLLRAQLMHRSADAGLNPAMDARLQMAAASREAGKARS
jgi:glycosyltransferase involved in cell wall biosynthesis